MSRPVTASAASGSGPGASAARGAAGASRPSVVVASVVPPPARALVRFPVLRAACFLGAVCVIVGLLPGQSDCRNSTTVGGTRPPDPSRTRDRPPVGSRLAGGGAARTGSAGAHAHQDRRPAQGQAGAQQPAGDRVRQPVRAQVDAGQRHDGREGHRPDLPAPPGGAGRREHQDQPDRGHRGGDGVPGGERRGRRRDQAPGRSRPGDGVLHGPDEQLAGEHGEGERGQPQPVPAPGQQGQRQHPQRPVHPGAAQPGQPDRDRRRRAVPDVARPPPHRVVHRLDRRVRGRQDHQRADGDRPAEQDRADHQAAARVDEHQAGRPTSSRTAPPTTSPSPAPPTTSSGRCALTYTRARQTATARTAQTIRAGRFSHGQATTSRAVTTAACPERKPRPCAAAPRTTPSSRSEAGRPRTTTPLTTLASTYTPAPATSSPSASRQRRKAAATSTAAGTARKLPSCITGQTTTNGSTVVSLSTRKTSVSAPPTRPPCTTRPASTSTPAPRATRATSGQPRTTGRGRGGAVVIPSPAPGGCAGRCWAPGATSGCAARRRTWPGRAGSAARR